MATEAEFSIAQERAARVLEYYQVYVDILQRLSNKGAPRSLHPFSAAGADAEGVRRCRGKPKGSDLHDQPDFRRRFGEGSFGVLDATDLAALLQQVEAWDPDVIMGSPPCKKYSTADMQKRSEAPDLIALARDHFEATGRLYAIENVKGAASELLPHAVLFYGSDFGLHVDRPRFFEANFPLRVDDYLRQVGAPLRQRTCLGCLRRWRRLDPFGRPERTPCCQGNILPVQGLAPVGVTLAESAAAMGVDADHMTYERLAQAIPPVYAQLVFSQACMERCRAEFGVPAIPFDEMRRNPRETWRTLRFWLRGAGEVDPAAGLRLEPRAHVDDSAGAARGPLAPTGTDSSDGPASPPPTPSLAVDEEGPMPKGSSAAEANRLVAEVEFREVYYSSAGGFEQQRAPPGAPRWLDALHDAPAPRPVAQDLVTRNTHLELTTAEWERWRGPVREALATPGTRLVVQLPLRSPSRRAVIRCERDLQGMGFRRVRLSEQGEPAHAGDEAPARLAHPSSWWAVGERRSAPPEFQLDLDAAEAAMDPRDRGAHADLMKEQKRVLSYMPVTHDPVRWVDTDLPAWVEDLMRRGAVIKPEVEPPFADHPFYRWESDQALLQAVWEADRHISVGSLEYVPDHLVAEVSRQAIVHPWVVAPQGDKWRLCHDYSVGTNRYVATSPFRLPSPWDVRPCLKPTSRMAKYDIRDGFFHIPVEEGSRRRLLVRHPGTGRLMWAPRLPFGYVNSPLLFCGVMEAIASKLRKRAAGRGIHFFVFVDDWLVVGDTEELTIEGCSMLEDELRERGITWAPHKQRGPTRCLEFLGLLLSNLDGEPSISLSRARRDSLLQLLQEWEEWSEGERRAGRVPRAAPKPLASLLGKLVFASQVVLNGRTYMQSMLSAFVGHEVDWRRGKVSFRGSSLSSRMDLPPDFWVDVSWWRRHLEERYSLRWRPDDHAEAAVLGTDASGWGTGQLAWLDGGREEVQLKFSHAERRRPINWRELLGIVRAVQWFGPRLRGRLILVETDNMAAKGAAAKRASKARDMQELVRRLVDACERYDIRLRLTHTPGALLDRPDQTSRGDLAEEPRRRLSSRYFRAIEAAWGPFGSFLGPERAHRASGHRSTPSSSDAAVDWFHPSHLTVGSALRLLHERAELARQAGRPYRAAVLVPDVADPAWAPLARHLGVVMRLSAGTPLWDEYVAGRWRTLASRRDMTLMVYPRPAGTRCVPLVMRSEEEHARLLGIVPEVEPWGWTAAPAGEGELYRPLAEGSLVYRPDEHGGRGTLSRVSALFDPANEEGAPGVELTTAAFFDSVRERKLRGGEVYYVAKKAPVYSYDPEGYWSVDHLVRAVPPADLVPRRPRDTDEVYASRVAAVTSWQYVFDWREADRQIASLVDQRVGATRSEEDWIVLQQDAFPMGSSFLLGDSPEMASSASLAASSGGAQGPTCLAPAGGGVYDSPSSLSALLGAMELDGGDLIPAAQAAETAPARSAGGASAGAGAAGSSVSRTPPPYYGGVRCSACDQPVLGQGTVCMGFVVHDTMKCVSCVVEREELRKRAARVGATPLSAQKIVTRQAEEGALLRADRPVGSVRAQVKSEGPVVGDGRAGSITSRTRFAERLGPQSMAAIHLCLDGKCDAARCKFEKTPCVVCGRGLHVAECGGFGSARAAMGWFKCCYCRAREMAPDREITQSLLDTASETMVLQLASGMENTAKSVADFNKLEQDFVVSKGLQGDERLLPRHGREAFVNFLTWCFRDADRARSMAGLWRSMSSIFSTWELVDLTRDPGVKKHFRNLSQKMGVTSEPATAATRKMFHCLLEDVIPDKQSDNALLRSRERLCYGLDGMTSLRIGEAADAGQGHGVCAPHVRLITAPGGYSWIDVLVETSKTHHARYTGCPAVSQNGIAMGRYLREYWAAADLPVDTIQGGIGGFKVEYANFWVLRVNLLGILHESPKLQKLYDILASVGPVCKSAVANLKTTVRRGNERAKASGPGSESKKFINVAGGRGKNDSSLVKLWHVLKNEGFESSIVEGPLIASTEGYGSSARSTLMPLSSGSVMEGISVYLAKAAAQSVMDGPDPDMDLAPGDLNLAKWSSHSLRRLFNTVALEYCEENGIPPEKVDSVSGWKEAERAREMHTHYDAAQLRKRMKTAALTATM